MLKPILRKHFLGANLGTVVGDLAIKVGNAFCVTASATDSGATCTLGAHAAGQFDVTASVTGKGAAASSVSFSYTLEVSSVLPITGKLRLPSTDLSLLKLCSIKIMIKISNYTDAAVFV